MTCTIAYILQSILIVDQLQRLATLAPLLSHSCESQREPNQSNQQRTLHLATPNHIHMCTAYQHGCPVASPSRCTFSSKSMVEHIECPMDPPGSPSATPWSHTARPELVNACGPHGYSILLQLLGAPIFNVYEFPYLIESATFSLAHCAR